MEPEVTKKTGLGKREKAGKDIFFRGVVYLIYGSKAGETVLEKLARMGVIIFVVAAIIVVFSIIKNTF